RRGPATLRDVHGNLGGRVHYPSLHPVAVADDPEIMRSLWQTRFRAFALGCAGTLVVGLAGCSLRSAGPSDLVAAPEPEASARDSGTRALNSVPVQARQLVTRASQHRAAGLSRRSLTHRSRWDHLEPILERETGP